MTSSIRIIYAERFKKQHTLLQDLVKKKAAKAVNLFLKNVLHPSLRLHKLSGTLEGLWSISIDQKYRIILEPMNDHTYLFVSIGSHAIYEKR